MSLNPSHIRKIMRPELVAGVVVAGALGWLVTRPDSSSVLIPYPEASIPIDAAIDAIDSAIDAPDAPDAAPGDMSTAWARWAILSESTGSTLKGSDGVAAADVNGDGLLDLTTGWEQSGYSTFSLHPGCANAKSTWSSVRMPLATSGVEDGTFGDVDADGRIDIIDSGSSSFRLHVQFAPALNANLLTMAQWTGVEITIANGKQRFLKSLTIDIDQDGVTDIVAGGYSSGASLDIYRSTTPRVGASWTREVIGTVGALYQLVARDMDGDGDMDLVITDRDGTGVSSSKGARWMKNPTIGGGSWTNVEIYTGVGNTRWIEVSTNGKTIVGGTSGTTGVSTTWILTCSQSTPSACNKVGGSAPAWAKTDITQPADIGLFNMGKLADIDLDGDDDIVIVYHHAYDHLSNVVWLRNDGAGAYTRGEISGVDGVKSDNFELYDVDCDGDLDPVVTDEGRRGDATVTPLGLVWYENAFGVP